MTLPPSGHEPVLMTEVLDGLRPPAGGVAVDCTLGRGGHSAALAEKLGPGGTLVALDVDPKNIAAARDRLDGVACVVRLFHANFADLGDVLDECGVGPVDAVLADLGVSTNQLLDPAYGLTFARSADGDDAPLDMRLDPRLPKSAADLVNRLPEKELANVLFDNAQERFSRRIARKIVAVRRDAPIRTSAELATLVRSVLPYPKRGDTIDPATRTFMALRMAVNAELPSLDRLLAVAPSRLKVGGRLGVISFHSGEDGRVKRAFRDLASAGTLSVVTKKPVVPGDAEVAANPRSRSAKLRVAERA